jgi:rSAM/selenodomain-associated transferase 2
MTPLSAEGRSVASTELSIIIPTFDAGATLGRTISALKQCVRSPSYEIVVADGSSTDGTVVAAEGEGARVVVAPRGRGRQLAAGAAAAGAPWLLFLHADTVLGTDWGEAVQRFMAEGSNLGRAATFRYALDSPAPAARRLERIVDWRCRRLGLPYGDQGLLIAAAFYRSLGGFAPLPLMEDVDLVRRIGRARLVVLDCTATTSAERYRKGFVRRSARNLACLALYFAGLPPRLIARLYG